MQQIIPMLAYEDGFAAIEWLKKAFRFTENEAVRFVEEGRITHAELCAGNDVIMLATPAKNYESTNTHRRYCEYMDKWLQTPYIINGLLVYVDDVKAHYEIAKAGGAEMLSGIEEGFPGIRYRCADLEGHRWMFMQKNPE